MAEIRKEKGKVFLELNEKERKELNTENNFFELSKVKKGLFVLSETAEELTGPKAALFDEEKQKSDEKIFSLLSEKGKQALSKKVEGEFEKQLSEEEKKRFQELLKEGVIEKFKLNESYKKAIYQIARKTNKPKKDFDVNSPKKTIESNGFEIMVNENQARNFCDQFSAEIKETQIKGIKGFDGYFYAVYSNVLEKVKPQILNELKENKTVSLKDLTERISFPEELIRGTIEFLKEDGEVLEKRKGLYKIIE